MAINRQYIQGSNGSGEAVRSTVTSTRTAGSTIIAVNSLTNWSTNFIATTGSINADNTLNIKLVFKGHIDGTTLIIDEIAPGYTDPGSVIGDVVVLKPSTFWADNLAAFLDVAHNDDGSIASGYVATGMLADGSVTTAKIATGAVTAAKTDGTLGWQEIGRSTNITTPTSTMVASSLPNFKYLKFEIISIATGGTTGVSLRFNSDSGSNYTYRTSGNGGADITASSQSSINVSNGVATYPSFSEGTIINVATLEKTLYVWSVASNTAGATNTPGRNETAAKWTNTSTVINSISAVNTGTGNYDAGSQLIVYGRN